MLRKFSLVAAAFLTVLAVGTRDVRAEPLKVAILDLPPMAYAGTDKKPTGVYVELAEALSAKSGVPITITVTPLPRVLAGLEDGSYDATVVLELPKANELAEKVAKLISFDNIVMGTKGGPLSNYDSLKGKSIANLRNFVYDPKFNSDPDIKKVESNSYEMNVNLLKAGRVDGMVGPDLGLLWQIKQMGMKADDFSAPVVLNTKTVHFYLSNKSKNAETAAKISAAAAALSAEKAFEAIVAKYTR